MTTSITAGKSPRSATRTRAVTAQPRTERETWRTRTGVVSATMIPLIAGPSVKK